MESWNVAYADDPEYEYILLNSSRTPIRLSERAIVDIAELLAKFDEARVPLAYADGLSEIYFTLLHEEGKDFHGDYNYDSKVIRISTARISRDVMHKNLMHEIGHHVDDRFDISTREKICHEKSRVAHMMPDSYARKDVSEYVACGFEVFYFGTRDEKRDFKKWNPKLFNVINYLHRKHSR